MKLADAKTDSARQRLKESNLNDLEYAFKEESPLSDSYDESSASGIGLNLKTSAAVQNQHDEDQGLDKKSPPQTAQDDNSGLFSFPGGRSDEDASLIANSTANDQAQSTNNPPNSSIYIPSGTTTGVRGDTSVSNSNGIEQSKENPSNTSMNAPPRQNPDPLQSGNNPFSVSVPQRANQSTVDFSSSTRISNVNTNSGINMGGPSETDPFMFSTSNRPDVPQTDNNPFSNPLPQRPSQATVGFNSNANLNSVTNNAANGGDSESDPFMTSVGTRRNNQLGSFPNRRNSQLSSSIVMNDSIYQTYYDDDPNYWRRTIVAAVIIVLAIIGLAIGLLAPGVRVEKNPNGGIGGNRPLGPTASPAPSSYSPDDTFSGFYRTAANTLIYSEVSPPGTLSRQCYHKLCGGDGDLSRLTIQERTLHFLIFQDETYKFWVFQDGIDNVERIVQRYILTLFAFSTGLEKDADDAWKSATWFEYNKWLESGSECNWFGLTCAPRSSYVGNKDFVDHTVLTTSRVTNDLPGREVDELPMVIEISLNKNNLRGQLPQEIFKLRHLEKIELWQNQITGRIHKDIRLLTSLRRLWLHETKNMHGKIPTEIGDLTDLNSVFLGGNRLTGTIPTELGNLSNLKTFAAFENELEGTIPSQISECTNLQRLFLDQNNLNGTIPELIGSLRDLEDLRIHDNRLEGKLPPQMTLLNNLKVLYVNSNMFTGSISDAIISGLISLKKMEASENKFTGTISTQFGRLPNLDTLVLHSNELNSEIPRSICDSGSLLKLDLARNKFINGPVPAELANCQQLKTLTLSRNNIIGPIPLFLGEMGSLQTLNLDYNKLSGQIPFNLASLPSLDVIRLINNNVEAVITEDSCDSFMFLSADCAFGGTVICSCENCCCNSSCN